ncbi:MAG: molybdopterin-guanine dinucleotide biosynthesis protein [Anaerolinea sp.]|nr:molybdopterin-guanine dinucleotide biosynthesis protein [Anaerolinea sp.]
MTPDDDRTVSLDAWLERLRWQLPAGTSLTISGAESAALLDLARVAAHTSERIAAPLSTFLAGVAFGGLPEGVRATRIAELVRSLEAGRVG